MQFYKEMSRKNFAQYFICKSGDLFFFIFKKKMFYYWHLLWHYITINLFIRVALRWTAGAVELEGMEVDAAAVFSCLSDDAMQYYMEVRKKWVLALIVLFPYLYYIIEEMQTPLSWSC